MAGSDYVQSVVRAVEIVEALAGSGGLGAEELARRVQVELSTVQNLLRTLQHRQWVVWAGKPAIYSLGPAIVEVGRAVVEQPLIARARRALAEVRRAIGSNQVALTCTERHGLDIRGVLMLTPAGTFEDPAIEIMPPYSKPSSLAYQAFGDEAFRRAFRHRWMFENYNGGHWPSEAALDAFLAEAREAGVVVLPRPDDALSAAVPVRNAGGEVVATLGIFGPVNEPALRALWLDVLKQAAAKASA